jgi:hypothetical protein
MEIFAKYENPLNHHRMELAVYSRDLTDDVKQWYVSVGIFHNTKDLGYRLRMVPSWQSKSDAIDRGREFAEHLGFTVPLPLNTRLGPV